MQLYHNVRTVVSDGKSIYLSMLILDVTIRTLYYQIYAVYLIAEAGLLPLKGRFNAQDTHSLYRNQLMTTVTLFYFQDFAPKKKYRQN